MKTAIYIEDGCSQLVITPETEFEKNALSQFEGKPIAATIFAGAFYDCRGGWGRQTAYREREGRWDSGSDDRSIILRVDAGPATPPAGAEVRHAS